MSDLTDAVEAAARAGLEAHRRSCGIEPHDGWEQCPEMFRHEWRERVAPTVAAAAPILRAQALEEAASEIADRACPYLSEHWRLGYADACRDDSEWLRARAAEERGQW